jgi:hypothetical protein
VADALAPYLLAGHFHYERFEVLTREIIADILEPARQIFSDSILSALRIWIERAWYGRRAGSSQPFSY